MNEISHKERQRSAIEKAREIVDKKSKEKGRPLFSVVKTFGCQMNVEPETI